VKHAATTVGRDRAFDDAEVDVLAQRGDDCELLGADRGEHPDRDAPTPIPRLSEQCAPTHCSARLLLVTSGWAATVSPLRDLGLQRFRSRGLPGDVKEVAR
jgi:hypothetical protein